MRRTMKLVALMGLAGLALGLPATAKARVFVGVRVGVPLYGPAYYYPPPPVYYAPPAVVYAPPVVVAPAPVVTPAAAPATCRQYRGDATVDGANQPFYGTACLEADGRWHIVN